MEAHSDVRMEDLAEAISKIIFCDSFLKTEIDFGYDIGVSTCVPITEADEVKYFVRKHRKGPTPFVFNRSPEPTRFMTVILRDSQDGPCLVTAYYGRLAPMEPWDARRKHCDLKTIEEADRFWSSHALIYNKNDIAE